MANASWAALGRRNDSGSNFPGIPSQKDLFEAYQIQRIQKNFPDDDIELAIQKYSRMHRIAGVMFLDRDGTRCVWGDDVYYYQTHKWREWSQRIHVGNRKYNVLKKEPTMSQIDQPKPNFLHALILHCSESGWNRPQYDKRHLLNIPAEILDIIIEFALTVSGSTSIQPSTAVSNWKAEPREPGYSLRNSPWLQSLYGVGRGQIIRIGHSESSEDYRNLTFARVHQFDIHGQYTEIRKIRRAPIDASFLRASKKLYSIGRPILYGKNPFIFAMTNPSSYFCPPTAMLKEEYLGGRSSHNKSRNTPLAAKFFELELYPWKPFHHNTMYTGDDKISEAIIAIKQQKPLQELAGWVYHDTFLRFLHTIGPGNAASLRTIKFNGTLQVHSCDFTICKRCPDDLLTSLKLYIPFIQALCKNVKRVHIHVEKDHLYKFDPEEDEMNRSINCELPLVHILENDLRQISTLEHLEVYYNQDDTRIANFALPAVKYFESRAAQTPRERFLTGKERRGGAREDRANGVCCEFCGEGHVWAECWNLCNFCGKFGHSRKACPKIPLLSWEAEEPNQVELCGFTL